MKKLVLTVALVALMVAAVFGGQALASNKPADVTVGEETLSYGGRSNWGYPPLMITLSGNAEISVEDSVVILDETYPGVRHVSLTIYSWGHDSGGPPTEDKVSVTTNLPVVGDAVMATHTTGESKTYEFDTDNWKLIASDYGAVPLTVHYWVTVTYPSNQW